MGKTPSARTRIRPPVPRPPPPTRRRLVRVHRTLPPHVGLGSGTQLALAVARALAELYDVERDARPLLHAPSAEESVPRSAPGRSTMAVSSSRAGGARTATTVVRSSRGCRFHPRGGASWPYLTGSRHQWGRGGRALRACPHRPSATSNVSRTSSDGAAACARRRRPRGFGRALSEVQEITGRWFASVQGGTFAPGAAVSWCGVWANGARQALARARGAPLSMALSRATKPCAGSPIV